MALLGRLLWLLGDLSLGLKTCNSYEPVSSLQEAVALKWHSGCGKVQDLCHSLCVVSYELRFEVVKADRLSFDKLVERLFRCLARELVEA